MIIETERLVLRPFVEADRAPFAAMNADPRVGEWLGGVRTPAESDATLARIAENALRNGFDFLAAERRSDGRVVGMIGLRAHEDSPPGPCLEVGWRLGYEAWGMGFATEGAAAALSWGFANLDAPEIVAFTAASNLKSQAVMRRIGMAREPARDFLHPGLAEDHPLRPHLLFTARRP